MFTEKIVLGVVAFVTSLLVFYLELNSMTEYAIAVTILWGATVHIMIKGWEPWPTWFMIGLTYYLYFDSYAWYIIGFSGVTTMYLIAPDFMAALFNGLNQSTETSSENKSSFNKLS